MAAAVDFCTAHLGCSLRSAQPPAFADVTRGNLRLLPAGPANSAARRMPGPGGRNRTHLIVDDIAAEMARLRAAGVGFRGDIVNGLGGWQIVLDDPSGNPIELLTPAAR
jgi:catechol 2,3-dioxygenase-like lactoylglutathione lyase family enzyme